MNYMIIYQINHDIHDNYTDNMCFIHVHITYESSGRLGRLWFFFSTVQVGPQPSSRCPVSLPVWQPQTNEGAVARHSADKTMSIMFPSTFRYIIYI